LRTRAIPECFYGCVSLWRGAISSVCTFTFMPPSRTGMADPWKHATPPCMYV